MNKFKYEYDIRQVDAWKDEEECWYWNNSIHLYHFYTASKDHKKAFLDFLRKVGITFKKGSIRVEDDGSVYEIVDKKTGEPLFAAVPVNF